jgi:hypothetical protein
MDEEKKLKMLLKKVIKSIITCLDTIKTSKIIKMASTGKSKSTANGKTEHKNNVNVDNSKQNNESNNNVKKEKVKQEIKLRKEFENLDINEISSGFMNDNGCNTWTLSNSNFKKFNTEFLKNVYAHIETLKNNGYITTMFDDKNFLTLKNLTNPSVKKSKKTATKNKPEPPKKRLPRKRNSEEDEDHSQENEEYKNENEDLKQEHEEDEDNEEDEHDHEGVEGSQDGSEEEHVQTLNGRRKKVSKLGIQLPNVSLSVFKAIIARVAYEFFNFEKKKDVFNNQKDIEAHIAIIHSTFKNGSAIELVCRVVNAHKGITDEVFDLNNVIETLFKEILVEGMFAGFAKYCKFMALQLAGYFKLLAINIANLLYSTDIRIIKDEYIMSAIRNSIVGLDSSLLYSDSNRLLRDIQASYEIYNYESRKEKEKKRLETLAKREADDAQTRAFLAKTSATVASMLNGNNPLVVKPVLPTIDNVDKSANGKLTTTSKATTKPATEKKNADKKPVSDKKPSKSKKNTVEQVNADDVSDELDA